jgi:glycosyltransferase involved in cell wall biosynthesis
MSKFFIFCHLLNDYSGSPVVLKSTLKALHAVESGVLYVGSQGHGTLDESNVPTRRYWYRRSRHRIVTFFTYISSQIALYYSLNRARDISPDAVVFVNTLMPFGAMFWGKWTGRSVIVHVHESSIRPAPLCWLLTHIAGWCAKLLLYVSNDNYARLPIAGPEVCVLPNPINQNIAERASEHLPVQTGTFIVLMLASPRAYKGVEEFMLLAKALRERVDIAFELVLNADSDELSDFIDRHSDATNVSIHTSTDDPSSFYARANLVLNLSRVDQVKETFGLTLVESMAFGVPVISPPVGGPTEVVTHGVEGYCIDSRDILALKAAVMSLVDDNDTYVKMSLAAKRRADDFSFSVYSAALRDALCAYDCSPP